MIFASDDERQGVNHMTETFLQLLTGSMNPLWNRPWMPYRPK